MNITILKFDSLASTNTEAIEQSKRGAEEGVCIVARSQTAGRGRHGRNWVSEKDSGLYFSIILRPKVEVAMLPLITLMTAVAVHDVLAEEYGIHPDIKWSNDVLVKGKKISGILAEAVETPGGLAVIVGIGINLTSANFPAEIAGTATSIKDLIGKTPDIDDLLQALTRFLSYFYSIFLGENGGEEIIEKWSRRSTYFADKKVRVTQDHEIFDATTCGLEKNGALRLRTDDGGIRIIQAGDVESLRENSDN
ncbi:MAG: biotin--[acetyl-CoA-carboxylase] ligase [Pyrinomonadaceae bacterium]